MTKSDEKALIDKNNDHIIPNNQWMFAALRKMRGHMS
jgi:hypothetical protein